MPALDLNPDIVQFVIDKVHEFHSREDVTFPEENEAEVVNEDLAEQFATDFAGDPYYQELTTTIDDLEPDQQMSLVALMWIGRGDYELEEWDEAKAVLNELREKYPDLTVARLAQRRLDRMRREGH